MMTGGQAGTFEVMSTKLILKSSPSLWVITLGLGMSVLLLTLLSEWDLELSSKLAGPENILPLLCH